MHWDLIYTLKKLLVLLANPSTTQELLTSHLNRKLFKAGLGRPFWVSQLPLGADTFTK